MVVKMIRREGIYRSIYAKINYLIFGIKRIEPYLLNNLGCHKVEYRVKNP